MTLREIASKVEKLRMGKLVELARAAGLKNAENMKREELVYEFKESELFECIERDKITDTLKETSFVEPYHMGAFLTYEEVVEDYGTENVVDEIETMSIREVLAIANKSGVEEAKYKKRAEIIEDIKNSRLFESLRRAKKRRDYRNRKSVTFLDEGYVYVMVSSEKPEIVKIGMTKREPEERAKELSSSTGVAMPYIVAYQASVENPSAVEKSVHEKLSDSRVNPNREFFRVRTREAIRAIEDVLEERSPLHDGRRSGFSHPTDRQPADIPDQKISEYEAVAQRWSEIDEDKAIVLSGLEWNDVRNLRALLHQRFGKESVVVRFAEEYDGTHMTRKRVGLYRVVVRSPPRD